MAKAVWQGFVTSPTTGAVIDGAEIHVKLASSGEYATLYDDRAGTAWPSTNPFTIGSDGFVQFYVDPERYRIEAYDGAQLAQFNDVLIGFVEEPYYNATTVTADDDATIDMLSALSEPGIYQLYCLGGTVAVDGDALRLRVSTDGSTVESGASDYETVSSVATNGSAADHLALTFSIGNDVSESASLHADIIVDDSGNFMISSRSSYTGTDGAPDGTIRTGRYASTGVTGIQVYASTGNILTGTFTLRRIG